MSEAAAHLDEVYEDARKNCNRETVDSIVTHLHALAFEAMHDKQLTSKRSLLPSETRDTLFSDEQRALMLEVLTHGEVARINDKYNDAFTCLAMQIGLTNDAYIQVNRQAVFIGRVLTELRSLQNLAAFTEIVVARLEQEIASLELALAYDQERECF